MLEATKARTSRFRRYSKAWGPFHALRGLLALRGAKPMADCPLPGGARVSVRKDTTDRMVLEKVLVDREYAHDCLPRDARTIVDAGANVGYASVFFAQLYPAAQVVALEPEPSNFEMLVRNTRDFPNVRHVRAALWSRRADLVIEDAAAEAWAFTVREARGGEPGAIPALGVDDLVDRGQSIDIFKMDIEGSEKEVFEADCGSWLPRVRCLVLELHDRLRPGCTDAVESALGPYLRNRYEVGENVFYVLGR